MAINNNFMSHGLGYVLVSVLALVGAGFIVRMYMRCKHWRWWRKPIVEEPSTDDEPQSGEKPVNEEKPQKSVEPVVELLRPKVESFSGNFGALRDIASDDNTDTGYACGVFDNVSNVIAVQYGDDAKKWFSAFAEDRKSWDAGLYKAKAAKLMELFKWCGVTPSDETEVVWGDVASRRYNRVVNIADGTTCQVLSPCWTLAGKLIEKGMVGRKG